MSTDYERLNNALRAYYIESISVDGGYEGGADVDDFDSDIYVDGGDDFDEPPITGGRSRDKSKTGNVDIGGHAANIDEVIFFVVDYIKGIKNSGL